jgi:hypothetical protein
MLQPLFYHIRVVHMTLFDEFKNGFTESISLLHTPLSMDNDDTKSIRHQQAHPRSTGVVVRKHVAQTTTSNQFSERTSNGIVIRVKRELITSKREQSRRRR